MTKKLVNALKYPGATALVATTYVSTVFAQTGSEYTDQLTNPVGNDNLLEVIKNGINFAIAIAGLIAVAVLIYSGVMYITAAGDEAKIEKATKGITYAVIGLVICFMSVLIVNFVIGLLQGGGTPTT